MTVHLPRRLHAPAVDVCAHGMPMDCVCSTCDWNERVRDARKRGLLDDVCACGVPVVFGCDCPEIDEKAAAMRAAVEGR